MNEITYWNDLKILTNISETFIAPKKYNEQEQDDLIESLLYFLDDYMSNNIDIYKDPYIENYIYNYLFDIIKSNYIDLSNEYELIDEVINKTIEYYFTFNIRRSYPDTIIINKPNVKSIKKKIKNYETMEQPEQRTPAWYNFRWTCLTASSIWKALDTDSNVNQLIVSKCVPINPKKYETVNTSSAIHNGHRFEPLSTMWYEKRFNTIVGEFGCIRHPNISFLGASPDGINIDPKNPRYGRAVEIKNPVNRELTGIPKKDYWIQMQLQMEVWDLDSCDFLETCFKCYENMDEFDKDGDFIKTKDGKLKGIIIQFYGDGQPVYKYPPLECSRKEFDEWYDKTLDENPTLTWTQNIYWYLNEWSCVLVPRNKPWFDHVLPRFKKVWNTILKERDNGEWNKRKPKKKGVKKKLTNKKSMIDLSLIDDNMKLLFNDLPDTPKMVNNTPVVKIRTESFDNAKLSE